jgi:hypothetical protein
MGSASRLNCVCRLKKQPLWLWKLTRMSLLIWTDHLNRRACSYSLMKLMACMIPSASSLCDRALSGSAWRSAVCLHDYFIVNPDIAFIEVAHLCTYALSNDHQQDQFLVNCSWNACIMQAACDWSTQNGQTVPVIFMCMSVHVHQAHTVFAVQ